jgi:hypothetical protein
MLNAHVVPARTGRRGVSRPEYTDPDAVERCLRNPTAGSVTGADGGIAR